MPKNSVNEWDENPDGNTDVGGISIAEGCPPGNINNAIRMVMAQIRSWNPIQSASEYLFARLRLSGTADASLTSTAHALQIGPTNGENLRADTNEIQAVNNGTASLLGLNQAGGPVAIGPGPVTIGNQTISALAFKSSVNNADWSGADLAISNGGTGASSASAARDNLGLGQYATLNRDDFYTQGGVGTYAYAVRVGTVNGYEFGDQISGGNLRPSNANGQESGGTLGVSTVYKCMGYVPQSATGRDATTLWLRVG